MNYEIDPSTLDGLTKLKTIIFKQKIWFYKESTARLVLGAHFFIISTGSILFLRVRSCPWNLELIRILLHFFQLNSSWAKSVDNPNKQNHRYGYRLIKKIERRKCRESHSVVIFELSVERDLLWIADWNYFEVSAPLPRWSFLSELLCKCAAKLDKLV